MYLRHYFFLIILRKQGNNTSRTQGLQELKANEKILVAKERIKEREDRRWQSSLDLNF